MECRTGGIIANLKNMVKNRFVLNQTEASFLDFKRKEFPEFAKERYLDIL